MADNQFIVGSELTSRVIISLDRLVKESVWRFQQAGIGGPYSPELQQSIDVLDELNRQQNVSECPEPAIANERTEPANIRQR